MVSDENLGSFRRLQRVVELWHFRGFLRVLWASQAFRFASGRFQSASRGLSRLHRKPLKCFRGLDMLSGKLEVDFRAI